MRNSNVWFTADLHLGHKNIIKYCERPFSNITEMDEYIIEMWNSYVDHNDEVFILGDVSLLPYENGVELYFRRLHGMVTVVPGGHDHRWMKGFNDAGKPYQSTESGWRVCVEQPICERRLDGLDVVLCHYPLRSWRGSNRNVVQLHGHTHGRMEPLPNQYDVGLDNNGLILVSLENIEERFKDVTS